MSKTINKIIVDAVVQGASELFDASITSEAVSLNETKKEFEGDITVVVFPLVRFAKKSPEETANLLGNYLKQHVEEIENFNVIKGFLNLEIADSYWLSFFNTIKDLTDFGKGSNQKKVVLEYCGPNTNKPLHLGHIRNMLLGYSTANLLAYAGNEVHKVNIYNDRGIAICKSMVAWQLLGNGATPESEDKKGDHFVGDYYVKFDQEYKKEMAALVAEGMDAEEAKEAASIMKQAREMLLKWEAGDAEVVALWNKMNDWVYEGFETTFASLGVDFEKHYKESEFYLRGKELVLEGVKAEKFKQREDGSVWVDLTDKKLDEKLLLRADGTSVYITQDMAIAEARYEDYEFDTSIYVVASEQDYHFKVLQLTMEKLGKSYADGIYHLSYGLVNLPDGRMKSREGTVVDADDLIAEMISTAKQHTEELGKIDDFNSSEAAELYRVLALGALKYFMLKVNPKKSVIFNPKESIDFQGDTGPFIQYTYSRIQSIIRKQDVSSNWAAPSTMNEAELALIKHLHKWPDTIKNAAETYDISEVAGYAYELAKGYNKFYASSPILNADDESLKLFRLQLSLFTSSLIQTAMGILGIDVPERM